MKVHEMVARFAPAGESADPLQAARQVLEQLAGDLGQVDHALDYISGIGGNARQVFYRSPKITLRKAGEKQLAPGSVLTMRAETVHVVECVGATPTVGLHVYGGDVLELPRRLWNPETLEEHPLDWTLYDSFARAASAAVSAPNPQ